MCIANEGEILEFLTYIMRREDEEIRMADSFKALRNVRRQERKRRR